MRYRLTTGRYARYEDGVRKNYAPDDELELSEKEALDLAMIIEPATVPRKPPVATATRVAEIPPSAAEKDWRRQRRGITAGGEAETKGRV